jgi:membrane protease YdiL (CAAX protease family)
MCLFFISRAAGVLVISVVLDSTLEFGGTVQSVFFWAIQTVFIYIVPLLFAMKLFNSIEYYRIGSGGLKELFAKPERLAKKLGNITALYGFMQGISFLTMLVFFLIPLIFPTVMDNFEFRQFFEPAIIEAPATLTNTILLVFALVIAAPLFEEFIYRGILYDALKPFGHGIAIFSTSILFGLVHANIRMLFYTIAAGFALGYIRYATNSLFVVTILHLIVNAVAAGLLLILSLGDIIGGNIELWDTISGIYLLSRAVFVIVGLIAFIKRIPVIRKYKIENNWTDISPKRKVLYFVFSIPMIIMLIMAIDVHANYPFLSWLISRL